MLDNLTFLRVLYSDLNAFAAPLGGKVSATGTYVETLELLINPTGFLVILEWSGEENPAEQGDLGIVTQDIAVYVGINPGLPATSGKALWLSEGGRTLLERVNSVRDRIREIRLPDLEEAERDFNYRDCRQVVTPEGVPLRAYRLLFRITNAIPDPVYRDIEP